MVLIALSKEQALDVYPKVMQQISFTCKIIRGEDVNDTAAMFIIIEEEKLGLKTLQIAQYTQNINFKLYK